MKKVSLRQGADYKGQMLGTFPLDAENDYVRPVIVTEDGKLEAVLSGIDMQGNSKPLITDHRGFQVPIDYLHNLVHAERVFTISHTFLNVPVNGKVSIMLVADGLPLHIPDFLITTETKMRLKSYLNPTVTAGTGIPYAPFNRYTSATNLFGGTVVLSPVFTSNVPRGNDFMGANTGTGGNAIRAGGNRSGGIETLIGAGDALIYEFENVGNAVSDINIIVNLYENQI